MGKSPEELEEWAYGNAPMRVPEMTSVPMIKTGRKEQLADTMFLGMDAAGLGKGAGIAARTTAKKLGPKAGQMISKSMDALGTPLQMNIVEPGPSTTQGPIQLTRQEKSAVIAAAKRNPNLRKTATAAVEGLHSNYPVAEGWVPIQAKNVTFKTSKTGDSLAEVETDKIPYDFHTPPEGVPKEAWQATLSSGLVDEVQAVVNRAASGDQAAIDILSQASWYRSMRDRLRAEFGGTADVFADVLGTTSAQTGVEQNFDNAVEILRRFSRGEYDNELAAFEKRIASGKPIDGKTLTEMHKSGKFPLITKASGQLFNANSPSSMGALMDMFRSIKTGDSPKTPNFTGNLIGLTKEATIDVWAARMLRRLADLPRIPPPAEKGVAGKHLVGSSLYDPKVGSEFGFGQDVFREAADEINNSGILKSVAPQIGNLGPDDLQAVAWFIEKENWTKNGWTTKAGEGGSLDYEMSLAGAPDQTAIKDLRREINAGFKPPAQRKTESDADYSKRVQEAKVAFDANKAAKQQQLAGMQSDVERYTLGVSGERPSKPMSNYAQAELAAEFDDVVRDDASVVTYNLANTYGSFMGDTERALNAEFVVRQNFNPSSLERRMVEQGKTYDQDAVFISKVVPDGASPNARPGVEIYFKQKMTPDQMAAVTAKLRQYGVDGFTYVTDMRFNDRINVQARAGGAETAGLNGLRFQYIPEFDDAYSAADQAKIMQQKEDLFQDIVGDIIKEGNVSDARLVFYDTKVYFSGDYDEYLTRTAGQANPTQGGARPAGADVAQPNTSGEVGKDFTRAVSNRLRKKTTSSKSSTVKRSGAAPTSGAE
jgi:pyruvate/2-oxoglutarate dehydrogenase complex dihydrolipoamide acyltransferase (E2) component